MLDFVKAMKIAERVCKAAGKCGKCILYVGNDINFCFFGSMDNLVTDWNEIERRLLAWDKAHPEPQYPTWSEWQRENFPDAHFHMFPCSFCTPAKFGCDGSRGYDCDSCRNQPIPADIAKKLGIQPNGGT